MNLLFYGNVNTIFIKFSGANKKLFPEFGWETKQR
jgi:hypothetical protein